MLLKELVARFDKTTQNNPAALDIGRLLFWVWRMPKFMLSVHQSQYDRLMVEAERLGITPQELLRAVVIPFYFRYELHVAEDIKKKIVESRGRDPSDFRKNRHGVVR